MYKKILGVLLGAAVGDAMGSATELRSIRQIQETFNGKVTSFCTPPNDTIAKGRKAGMVTDAFSIPYILIQYKLRTNVSFSTEMAQEALMEWASNEEWFELFAGMTTRKVINRLKEDGSKVSDWAYAGHLGNKLFKGHYYALSSNGAATKAFPMGLFNPGDLDKAIDDTIAVTMSSHDDKYSISGACAVAAAVSKAMEEKVNVYDIVQAGLYGAKIGEERGAKTGLHYPGPSVQKRMDMAVNIAVKEGNSDIIMKKLADIIGSGPGISETVPAAFGLFIANNGNTMESIFGGVNIGDETSAIASISGALGGAYNGVDSITEGYQEVIEEKNGMNLSDISEKIYRRICK
ncbi:ADP-ribosylglycohydrolase family protein [Tissierella sp.]|uniref:ADP-ribosylglycohydrolase family protein n=1 Tax=Tissierella sp. TaxID=41274 RepID=UPI0028A694C2|nr:ADP-ribosylglycohydrolase family protein [Tissierella sp.]